jgi:FkbM family methyltransferase
MLKNNYVYVQFLVCVFFFQVVLGNMADIEKVIDKESLSADDFNYLSKYDLSIYKLYTVPGLGKFYIDVISDLIKGVLSTGTIWEPEIHTLIQKHAKSGTVAIDIGAFVGSHAVAMSKAVGRLGQVIAFEPSRKIFAECAINLVVNNCFNAKVYRCALGAKQGMATMKVLDGGEAITHVSGVIYKSNKINKKKTLFYENVELRTLDSFNFNNVSLIKIDVEDFQDNVIAGALQTIKTNRPVIIFESSDPFLYARNETAEIINALGYTCKHIKQSDWIAIPN